MDKTEIKELETILRIVVGEILPVDDLKVVAAQQKQLLDLVEKHDATLYGNGKEGLTTTVSRIDHWVSSAQDTLDEIFKWAVITLLGGGATTIIVLAVRNGLIK